MGALGNLMAFGILRRLANNQKTHDPTQIVYGQKHICLRIDHQPQEYHNYDN